MQQVHGVSSIAGFVALCLVQRCEIYFAFLGLGIGQRNRIWLAVWKVGLLVHIQVCIRDRPVSLSWNRYLKSNIGHLIIVKFESAYRPIFDFNYLFKRSNIGGRTIVLCSLVTCPNCYPGLSIDALAKTSSFSV